MPKIINASGIKATVSEAVARKMIKYDGAKLAPAAEPKFKAYAPAVEPKVETVKAPAAEPKFKK